MRIALVTSSYGAERHGVGAHVHQLASRLACEGATVEVITPAVIGLQPPAGGPGDVVVHRFSSVTGPARFAASAQLRARLRTLAGSFDLADVHCSRSTFALIAANAGFRRLVFTIHAPLERLLSWPETRATAALLGAANAVACSSQDERDRLRVRFPHAAARIEIVPRGVDVAAIRAAAPVAMSGAVILAAGPLVRSRRLDRVIAAMAGLSAEHRLVIMGRGPDRQRLQAYAADMKVSERLVFADPPSPEERHRWFRSARVVVVLAPEPGAEGDLLAGLAAGAQIVASDNPVHRELALLAPRHVVLVPSMGSPLGIAEAINEAARRRLRLGPEATIEVPSWDTVADATRSLYRRVVDDVGADANAAELASIEDRAVDGNGAAGALADD